MRSRLDSPPGLAGRAVLARVGGVQTFFVADGQGRRRHSGGPEFHRLRRVGKTDPRYCHLTTIVLD
jgi:hypothetical protein